jgi:hypothetical protein
MLPKSCITDVNIDTTFHSAPGSALSWAILHSAYSACMKSHQRASIHSTHILTSARFLSLSYGSSVRIRVMASPVFPILFSAADFHFRTWSRASASFCTLFSHLLRDLPTSHLPPKLPPKIHFGMRWSYKFITWSAYLSLFILQLCILSDSSQPLWVGRSKYFFGGFSVQRNQFYSWLV